jgi:hypothetical protein
MKPQLDYSSVTFFEHLQGRWIYLAAKKMPLKKGLERDQ